MFKKLLFLSLYSQISFAVMPTIYGDLSTKFERRTESKNTKLSNFSALSRVGIKGTINERVYYNTGVLFNANSTPNYPYSSFTNDFGNTNIVGDLYYIAWKPFPNTDWYFGKHNFPFQKTDLLWDENVNPTGSSQVFKHTETNTKFSLGEYVLQGSNQGLIPFVIAGQALWYWAPTPEWKFTLAGSGYIFKSRPKTDSLYALPESRYSGNEPVIMAFYGKAEFPFDLNLNWEVSYNLKSRNFSDIGGTYTGKAFPVALLISGELGHLKSAYDWVLKLQYTHKGIGAAPGSNTWTSYDSPLDYKGLHIMAGLALEDSLFLKVKTSFLNDADNRDELGNEIIGTNPNIFKLSGEITLTF